MNAKSISISIFFFLFSVFIAAANSPVNQTRPYKPEAPFRNHLASVAHLYGHEKERIISESRRIQAREGLENFIVSLKSHIFKGVFDVFGFEAASQQLSSELQRIEKLAILLVQDDELEAHLRHSKFAFTLMRNSVTDLKQALVSEIPGSGWLYKIIELNVRLLVLQDPVGRLDVSLPGFIGRIFGFWRNVHIWGMKFRMMQGIPNWVRVAYERESAKAERKIESLGIQMPEDKAMCSV